MLNWFSKCMKDSLHSWHQATCINLIRGVFKTEVIGFLTCVECIVIGNHCLFANNIIIVGHNHVISDNGVMGEFVVSHITIEDYVWCEANVTITKGVHVGAVVVDMPAKNSLK